MFIGVGHDNPHLGEVSADQVRFSAGIAFAKPIQGLSVMTLGSGFYARFAYHGVVNKIGEAYHYIFGHWEGESKKAIDHSKPVFQCFESVPNAETKKVLIYVPINHPSES
jgi:DNA gyrase inhibitor GyrI